MGKKAAGGAGSQKVVVALLAAVALGCLVFVLFTSSDPAASSMTSATDSSKQAATPKQPARTQASTVEDAPAEVQQLADGITKKVLKAGGAVKPTKGSTITVECTGYLTNGKKFWSTRDPGGKPFSFKVGVGSVIVGWDVGCLSMTVGEHSRLVVRGDKAYGERGFPAWGIGPNAELTFDIEILSIA
eukprot:m.296326 g.296326  ORF g.296326 m.296326 type:complete len:187 (-) comp55159_c0_seq3:109-669(-)